MGELAKKVVLVTGSNRGLGAALIRELASRNYIVIGGVRSKTKLSQCDQVYIEMTEENSIRKGVEDIIRRFGRLDIVINNAGVYYDDPRKGFGNIQQLDVSTLECTLKSNTIGPYILSTYVLPYMLEQGYGRIVSISSGMGRLSEFDEYSFAYRSSKLLLNAMTISFSKLLASRSENVAITAVCPGWIRTDMGTVSAPVDAGLPAYHIANLLEKEKSEINGKFFRNQAVLNWANK